MPKFIGGGRSSFDKLLANKRRVDLPSGAGNQAVVNVIEL